MRDRHPERKSFGEHPGSVKKQRKGEKGAGAGL